MEDRVNVLVAVPAEMPDVMKGKMKDMFSVLYNGCNVHTRFVNNVPEFLNLYRNEPNELVICFDDIRFGAGYAQAIGRNTGVSRIIVVIPNECVGDGILVDLIRNGFSELLLQKDFNLNNLRRLNEMGRTREEALMYCHVDFRPVRVDNTPMEQPHVVDGGKSSTGPGSSIRRKVIDPVKGIAVTQLLAQDARYLKGVDVEEEEYDLSMFDDFELTEEEQNSQMLYREYPVDEEWVDICKDELKKRFKETKLSKYNDFRFGALSEEDFRKEMKSELLFMKVDPNKIEAVMDSFIRDLKSYGKLDVLVHDKSVSDIRMMSHDVISIQSRGVWYRTNIRYRNDQEYKELINIICQRNAVNFTLSSADVVFPDEISFKGEAMLRVSATNYNLNVNRICSAHIRITRKEKMTASELVKDGFMGVNEAAFLANKARQKKSMIICGGSGSGKTILLNCLLEYFPRSVCGEIIQESSELFAPNHMNIKSSNSVESKGTESKVEHDLKALAATALLRNAEIYCIGEIKGDEAASFYTASRTTSVYTTTHANNCFGAIPRIAELALAAKAGNSKEDVMRVLAETIDTVIYCEKYSVKQVAVVKGWDEDKKDILYHLYDFKAKQ